MTHVLTSRHKCSILQRQKVTLFQPLNWSLNITVIGALFNFSNVFLFFPHFLFTQSWDFHFYNLLEGTWMNHSLIGAMYNKWCHISSQKRLVFGFSASMAVLSYFAVPCTSAKSVFWSALTLVWTGNSLRISGQSQHQDRRAEFENTFDCGHFFQTVNSMDGEHVLCNFHILHALIASYPEVQAQRWLKCVAICQWGIMHKTPAH